MSIRYQNFIIYGYKISYKKYSNDIKGTKFEKEYNEYNQKLDKDNLVVVADGMGGEYCYIGIIQYASDKQQVMSPIPSKSINPKLTEDKKSKLDILNKKCPIKLENCNHYIFTHTT